MTDRELLQQVLDAWQDHWVDDHQSALLEMIRANCANCARCGEKNPAEIHTCTPMHWSDCAVHSEPAYPAGECDCGLVPVAWADKHDIEREGHDFYVNRQQPAKDGVPLYTAPPQRKWQGLTDEEMRELWDKKGWYVTMFKAVEAKLKEKNSG
jgi:hypothetical protein